MNLPTKSAIVWLAGTLIVLVLPNFLAFNRSAAYAASESLSSGSFLSSFHLPPWLYVLILIFLVLLIFVIFHTLYQRKTAKEVNRLERWKNDIEQRTFPSELAKIKELNLAGETEKKFERWKEAWEAIVTVQLPDIEELLLDSEDDLDRYRYLRSKKNLEESKLRLGSIEATLQQMLTEIEHLIAVHRHNRETSQRLEKEFQKIKPALYQQALSLGLSYPFWHEKIKKCTLWFQQSAMAEESGDYENANDFLEAIETELQKIANALEQIPPLIVEIETNFPQQLQELEEAVEEMQAKGYLLDHTDVPERINALKQMKAETIPFMELGQIEEMKRWLNKVQEQVEGIYYLLEEEVESKVQVLSGLQEIGAEQEELRQVYEPLLNELHYIKAAYSWEPEWEEGMESLIQSYQELETISTSIQQLEGNVQQKYPLLKPLFSKFYDQKKIFLEQCEQLEQLVKDLREEEMQAKKKTVQLKQRVLEIKLRLQKSNLPGIPDHIQVGLQLSRELLAEIEEKLGQIPLAMTGIQHLVQEAVKQVEGTSQGSLAAIEQAADAERLIQFGYRYRRTHREINQLLNRAEQAFRGLQFEQAVELCKEALDQADSKWREKAGYEEEFERLKEE